MLPTKVIPHRQVPIKPADASRGAPGSPKAAEAGVELRRVAGADACRARPAGWGRCLPVCPHGQLQPPAGRAACVIISSGGAGSWKSTSRPCTAVGRPVQLAGRAEGQHAVQPLGAAHWSMGAWLCAAKVSPHAGGLKQGSLSHQGVPTCRRKMLKRWTRSARTGSPWVRCCSWGRLRMTPWQGPPPHCLCW